MSKRSEKTEMLVNAMTAMQLELLEDALRWYLSTHTECGHGGSTPRSSWSWIFYDCIVDARKIAQKNEAAYWAQKYSEEFLEV